MPSVYEQTEYRIYYSVFERCWEGYSTKRHELMRGLAPMEVLALVLAEEASAEYGNQNQPKETQARACNCNCGADPRCEDAGPASASARGGSAGGQER